jgi:putative copper export protein
LHTANDIVHDLSAGLWPGAAAALWLIRSRTDHLPGGVLSASLPAWPSVFLIMLVALAALVVTGAVRLNYRSSALTAGTQRTRTVLVKHTVFTLVFIASTVVAFRSIQA